jgi:hypothetical protein
MASVVDRIKSRVNQFRAARMPACVPAKPPAASTSSKLVSPTRTSAMAPHQARRTLKTSLLQAEMLKSAHERAKTHGYSDAKAMGLAAFRKAQRQQARLAAAASKPKRSEDEHGSDNEEGEAGDDYAPEDDDMGDDHDADADCDADDDNNDDDDAEADDEGQEQSEAEEPDEELPSESDAEVDESVAIVATASERQTSRGEIEAVPAPLRRPTAPIRSDDAADEGSAGQVSEEEQSQVSEAGSDGEGDDGAADRETPEKLVQTAKTDKNAVFRALLEAEQRAEARRAKVRIVQRLFTCCCVCDMTG